MDNPLTTADVDAADQQEHAANAGAANFVMETTPKEMANPDDVADAIKTSKAYSDIYGTPAAPTSAAIQFKPDFTAGLTRAKNSTILSTAPILSAWARDPDNAALARDDLSNLGWWEGGVRAAGADLQIAAKTLEKGGQQYLAEAAQERMRTQGMSFLDLLRDRQGQATGIRGTIANIAGGPSDILAAASQWIGNQISSSSGVDDAAAAKYRLLNVGQVRKQIEAIQPSLTGQAFSNARQTFTAANPNASGWDVAGDYLSGIATDPQGFMAHMADTTIQSLPPLAVATLATAVSKNPAVGAAVMGATSFAQERYTTPEDFFKAQGIDIATPEGAELVLKTPSLMADAEKHGLIRGAIIGVLNGLSGGIAGNELMKNPVANMAVQTIVQSALGAGGEAGAQYATTGKVDMQKVIETAFSQAVGAPLEVFGVGGKAFMQDRAKANAAEARVNFFKAMSDTAQASKLRERLPEKYRQYVDAATKGGPIENVYVPADKFVEYFQSKGTDPETVASVLDGVGPEDLNNAIATGGDLKIPTSSYATHIAGTEHDVFFSDNMKFSPDAMTAAQARDFNEAMVDHLDLVTAQAARLHEQEKAMRPHEQEIYDTMVSRLRAAGRSTEVATTEATLFPAFYRVMAERSGKTIDEFMRQYPLPQVRGSVPETLTAARGGELTQTLDNARALRKLQSSGAPVYPLLNFIHDNGGIIDTGGELHARDAAVVKQGKGKKNLKLAREVKEGDTAGKTKHSVDNVAHAAMEAGFLDDHPLVQQYRHAAQTGEAQPDITPALYDVIDKEMGGTPQHAGEEATRVQDEANNLDNIQRYLEEIGTSLDAPNEEIAAAMEFHRGREYGQGSLDALIAATREKRAARAALTKIVSAAGDSARYEKDGGRSALTGPDMSELGKWRLTRFDKDGPIGHTVFNTKEEAIDSALSEGYTPRSPETNRGREYGQPHLFDKPPSLRPAVRYKGKAYSSVADHLSAISQIPDENGRAEVRADGENRGYVNERGKYLDRFRAQEYAVAYGLLKDDAPSWAKTSPELISENLRKVYEQNERGSISIPADGIGSGETVIRLFDGADLSTMLHESGHYFLSVMQDMARREPTQVGLAEPPVPDGMVRVYHSGSVGEGDTGRWVANKRQYAADYRPNLPLHYLDLPEDDPRLQGSYPDQGVKQGFQFNFETTPKEATRLVEIPREAPTVRSSAASDFEDVKGWWRDNAGAVAKDAGKGVKAADVLKALDEGTTGNAELDAKIDTGMQEQFARAFESYLMEGKAPSKELQGAFDKFRTWLVSIYKRITGLGVNVSPEITRVFDRMLASDEQIQNAQVESGGGLEGFTSAEQLGMTPKQWETFQAKKAAAESDAKRRLLASVMGPVRREASKAYKAERENVNKEVSDEFNSEPVYRATEWLSKGRWFGDKRPVDVPEMKLNRKQLVDKYGPGILSALPRGVSAREGADIDLVAGQFGFGSGDEMVKAMRDAPKREDAIEAETERRMAERHNDPLNDGSIEAESLKVVNNERRGEWIAEELKAIHDVAGLPKPLKAAEARGIAKAAMGRMTVRDAMNDRVYLAAMRKAAEEAARLSKTLGGDEAWLSMARSRIGEAARKGDASAMNAAIDKANAILESTDTVVARPGAQRGPAITSMHNTGLNETIAKLADAKRRQLLNHALYQESRNVQAEVAKAERFVNKLGRSSTREKIAGAGRRGGATVDYLAAIDEVIGQYDFSRLTAKAERSRSALADYVQQMKDAGREAEIGPFVETVAANAARGQPYKTLPVDELRGVYATLKNLEHTASIWDKHLDDINKKTFDQSADDIVRNITENLPLRPPGRTKGFRENARQGIRKFINVNLFASTILREIDGFRDFGDAFSIMKRPIDKGMNDKQTAMEDATKRLQAIVEKAYTKDERYDMSTKEFIPEIGMSLSKNERLAVAANMGNAGNLERLQNGARFPWTADQIQAIVSTLDARDAHYIQDVWDFIGSFKDQIAKIERDRTGTEPKWVDAQPVTIGGVDLRGGYYPIDYDPRLSGNTIDRTAEDIASSVMGGRAAKAQTKDGFTKARTTSTKRDLSLDMQSTISRHLNEVMTDLHLGDAVNNASRLLNDGRVRDAFVNAGRDADLRNLKLWLLDTASGQMHSSDWLNSISRKMKNNLTFAKLAFNVASAAKQVSGIAQTAVVLGKKYTALGVRDSFKPYMVSQIPEKSSFMAERKNTMNQHISDFMSDNTSGAKASRLKDFKKSAGKAAFFMIQQAQYYTADVPTWLGGYQKGLDQFGGDEAKAIAYADDIVKRAQGSGLISDRSGFERGSLNETMRQSDFVRMFTALGSYTFTKANAFYERTAIANKVIRENGASLKTAQEALSYAIDMGFLFSLEAVVSGVIAGNFAVDNQHKDEDWRKWLAEQTAWSIASVIPGVRDVAPVIQGNNAGGAYGSITHDVADPFVHMLKGDFDKKSFWKSVVNGSGLVAGTPSVAMNRIIDSEDRRQNGAPGWSPLEYAMGQRGSKK